MGKSMAAKATWFVEAGGLPQGRPSHFLALPQKQIEWSQRQIQASAFKGLSSVTHLYHPGPTASHFNTTSW